ncbi:MAG: hypothetical protein ACEPOZ_18030 [Marinifilaceae bacterium]
MKGSLTKENLEKAEIVFHDYEHFTHIISPRLKALYRIKKELKNYQELKWRFNYNHANQNNNVVEIEFTPCQGTDFNFFFQIPLRQSFEFRLFLGTSSIHFIELYNHLINNKIISKDEFPIKAEYRTIPHFILNKDVKRYQLNILKDISRSNDIPDCIDDSILKVIKEGLDRFIPIFHKFLKA